MNPRKEYIKRKKLKEQKETKLVSKPQLAKKESPQKVFKLVQWKDEEVLEKKKSSETNKIPLKSLLKKKHPKIFHLPKPEQQLMKFVKDMKRQ